MPFIFSLIPVIMNRQDPGAEPLSRFCFFSCPEPRLYYCGVTGKMRDEARYRPVKLTPLNLPGAYDHR